MVAIDRKAHWENVYSTKGETGVRRTEENNWSTSDMSGCRISASLSHGGQIMEITGALRDLLTETADSLSGAERRRFMANTLNKLQLGQREAASLFGWGRDTLRKAGHELRTGLTSRMPIACADASLLSFICPICSMTFAASFRTICKPTPPSRPPACIVAYRPPRSASS